MPPRHRDHHATLIERLYGEGIAKFELLSPARRRSTRR
jgi:hypothetical protein